MFSLVPESRPGCEGIGQAVSEPLKRWQFTVYLCPWAVVTVRVKGHRLRLELLDDRVILIQQSCGHLVGAPAVCPPAVPAGGVSCQQHWHRDKGAFAVSKDASSYQSSTLTAGWASSCSAVKPSANRSMTCLFRHSLQHSSSVLWLSSSSRCHAKFIRCLNAPNTLSGKQTKLTQKKLQSIWWLRCCRIRSHSLPASPPPSTDFLHSLSAPRTPAHLWR